MFIESNGMPVGNSPRWVTQITIPKFYYQISNTPGNFSVLELPALPNFNIIDQTGAHDSYLYPAQATLYTYVTLKPLVGGYTGRQNDTDTGLLTSIPVVVGVDNILNGADNYTTMGGYNATNQTVHMLYKDEVRYVVVQREAFNQSQLTIVDSYLSSVFGSPVYSDNTTIAFETTNAIDKFVR